MHSGFIRPAGLLLRWCVSSQQIKMLKAPFCSQREYDKKFSICTKHHYFLRLQSFIFLLYFHLRSCPLRNQILIRQQSTWKARLCLSPVVNFMTCSKVMHTSVEFGEQLVGTCGWRILWPITRQVSDLNQGSLLYISPLFGNDEECYGIEHLAWLWVCVVDVDVSVADCSFIHPCFIPIRVAGLLIQRKLIDWSRCALISASVLRDPPICTGSSLHQLVKVHARAWLWTSVRCSVCTYRRKGIKD